MQRGLRDPRSGLWREMLRVWDEVAEDSGRPLLLIENVANLRTLGLRQILQDISARGCDAQWDVFSAADYDAPHRRERLFILAYPSGERCFGDEVEALRAGEGVFQAIKGRAQAWPAFGGVPGRGGRRLPHSGLLRVDDGIPSELDVRRVAACGNSIVPCITQAIGEEILRRLS